MTDRLTSKTLRVRALGMVGTEAKDEAVSLKLRDLETRMEEVGTEF